MLSITLAEAKNIAIGLVVLFGLGSLSLAWLMKTVVQKIAAVAVLAIFAFAVWTQRTSLQDCADKVKDAYALDGVNPTLIDTDCSFFGTTITISDPRSDATDDNG